MSSAPVQKVAAVARSLAFGTLLALVYLWLGLAISGPVILLLDRRALPRKGPDAAIRTRVFELASGSGPSRPGERRPELGPAVDELPRYSWAELAWLSIGSYCIFVTVLAVPASLGDTPLGVLAVFLADVALRRESDAHDELHADEHPAHHGGHRVVGLATFLGLSLHTLGGAIAIGLGPADSALTRTLVAATLTHKSAEAFSLASVLLLGELSRRSIIGLLVAYALVSPVGRL